MNFRTTLILFVLVAAGLVFFIVANRSGTPTRNEGTDAGAAGVTEGRKLLDLKPDDVRRLVIRPAEGKGQVVELVKAEPEKAAPGAPPPPAPNADWKIVQPAAWQADGFEARGLVEQVLNVRSRGRVQGNPDRAAFGLDKPRYTIEVTDKNNKTTTISVGNRSALGNDLYVDVGDGQGVSMAAGGQLAGRLEGGTEKIFEAVRDKRLVTGVTTADVSHVEITPRRGDKLVLQKQGADWKVVAPK